MKVNGIFGLRHKFSVIERLTYIEIINSVHKSYWSPLQFNIHTHEGPIENWECNSFNSAYKIWLDIWFVYCRRCGLWPIYRRAIWMLNNTFNAIVFSTAHTSIHAQTCTHMHTSIDRCRFMYSTDAMHVNCFYGATAEPKQTEPKPKPSGMYAESLLIRTDRFNVRLK